MKTRICFIRHGETDWNVAHRIQEQTDVPLNESGRSQALAMAFNAGHYNFGAIVSSDLQRALAGHDGFEFTAPVGSSGCLLIFT